MNPFDVNKNARAVIISYKADIELIKFIQSLNIDIIFSKQIDIDQRIADHPDLQIHPVTKKLFVASKDTYDYYRNKLISYGIEVIEGENEVGSEYPFDCRYNVARVSDKFIYNERSIDEKLLQSLNDFNLHGINQKQGYAKCMCICFEDFIITNDKGIYNSLHDYDLEKYLISNDGILLDGFDIGFLGGSCGIIDKKKILFTGDLSKLKEYNNLMEIFNEKNIEVVYPNAQLRDLGSIIPIV